MSNERDFLPHFISDDIYVIKEGQKTIVEESTESVETENSQTSIVEEPAVEPVALKPIHTHGENLKHCIVMFSAEGKLDADSKGLLFKILAAIDRTPKDVLMANVHGCSDESIEALIHENNHRQLISFGVKKPDLLSNATVYEPISEKGKHYLLSDHLEDVAVDNTKKRALWQALQSIFK